jgi:hypothetical protein
MDGGNRKTEGHRSFVRYGLQRTFSTFLLAAYGLGTRDHQVLKGLTEFRGWLVWYHTRMGLFDLLYSND